MAVEKILNTRIQLKYDSYSNWSTNNPTLKAGEVAIAYLAASQTTATPDNGTHPVMFKVGPGKFNDLPWASALAADVHAWAKKNESEFTAWVKTLVTPGDINAYTKGEIDSKLSANSTADQKYAKDYADGLAKNYDPAGKAQELISALDITDAAVAGQYVSAVSETDGLISVTRANLPTYTLATGTANGTVAFNGADVAVKGLGSAAYQNTSAFDAAGSAATAKSEAIAEAENKVNDLANGAVKDNTDAIDAIKDHASVDSFDDVMTEMAKYQIAGDYATKADAQGYANAKDSAIAEAKKAGTDAAAALNTYKTENNAAVALKADKSALETEVSRAKAAEAKALEDAKAYVDGVKEALLGEGIKDTFDTLVEIQNWIEGDGVNAGELSGAIATEKSRAEAEEARLAGLIADNAEAIEALNAADGKVANAGHADNADHATNADNATNAENAKEAEHAESADKATDADKLGGTAAANYLKKADAPGYADILTKTAAASAYQPKGNYATAAQGAKADTAVQPAALNDYYTKTAADAAFMDASETDDAIDAKITALNLANTYEPKGAESRANAYADSLAGNYATKAQGAKADSALQSIAAGTGLKVSAKANNSQTIEIDEAVVFVFNCGSSTELV